MRLKLWTLATVGFFTLACMGSSEEDETTDADEEVEDEDEGGSEISPVNFPNGSLDATEDQFVLAPRGDSVDKALEEGKAGTFIFYGGTVVSVGDEKSTIKSLSGDESELPNSLIVPIKSGIKARKGDILLGHWEKGSGLRRAIVIGGSPEEPVVRYLDTELDSSFDKEDVWKEGRFQKIRRAGDLGSSVACEDGSRWEPGILLGEADGRMLISGFAASLEGFDADDCVKIDLNHEWSKGDTVWVPVVNSYVEGTVKGFVTDLGRINVEYEWAGKKETKAFNVLVATPNFDGGPPTKGRKGKGKRKAKKTPVGTPKHRDGKEKIVRPGNGGKPAPKRKGGKRKKK